MLGEFKGQDGRVRIIINRLNLLPEWNFSVNYGPDLELISLELFFLGLIALELIALELIALELIS
jgi:hypothetical protein